MRKKRIDNSKYTFMLSFLVFVIVIVMTVGYAQYGKVLNTSGIVGLKAPGIVEITKINLVESSNVKSSTTPVFEEESATFHVVFGGTDEKFRAIYEIEIVNDTFNDYVYSDFSYDPVVRGQTEEDIGTLNVTADGIQNGDVIAPGETKTFRIILDLDVTNPNASYDVNVEAEVEGSPKEEEGNLIMSFSPNSGNIRNPNTLAHFTAQVINTYSYSKKFTIRSSNSNFLIVNSSGNSLGELTIDANSTSNYDFYIKQANNAIFTKDTYNINILLRTNGSGDYQAGEATMLVDIYVAPDTTIPTVGNVKLVMSDTEGEMTASWDRIDTGGTDITGYGLRLYNSSNNLVKSTSSVNTSYSFTGLNEGTYYLVVFATDEAGNTGSGYVSSATTADGYASKSSNVTCKWNFSVTNDLTYLSSNGSATAKYHQAYNATLSVTNSRYNLPTSVTIDMNNKRLTSETDYTYNSNTGAIKINSVEGDITITATGRTSCLVEGTKILLANGKEKNIENINYDDLLLVYNNETGQLVKEYPIWIEKTKKATSYQEIKFSDGSILKTVGFHGIFNTDLKRYVSVDNEEEFGVGTNVLKLGFNNKLIKTKVISIKKINKNVNYYHVVSTRYYNIFANKLLTTDGTVILSNLYGFDDNYKWPKLRSTLINNSNNLYDYSEFSTAVPYYMFKGMRMEEAKILSNYGLNKNEFLNYLVNNQLNKNMVKEPIKINKINAWMVSTSDNYNKLLKEGSVFKLPQPKNKNNFKYWYSSSDNKKYYPNDEIIVYHGMHFEAISKKSQ